MVANKLNGGRNGGKMKKLKCMALLITASMLFTACGGGASDEQNGSRNDAQNGVQETQQNVSQEERKNELQSNGEEGSWNDAEKEALKNVTLVLDYVPNTNHTGFYVAQELGYFAEQGLEVEIIEPGDNDSTTLCAVGMAEFAVTYQENVTYARAAAEPLPIRAIATVIQHNTSGFVTKASAGIATPKDFEGKVYAGWQAPSEAAVLEAVMKKYDADFNHLTMVGATGAGLGAMTNGIDIQWEFEGWSVMNDRIQGYDVAYMPVKDLDVRLDYYTPVIITNETMINNDSKTVFAFMTAVKQGYEYAIANPEKSAEILAEVIPEYDIAFLKESQKFLSEQYSLDSKTWGVMKDEVWDGYTEFMYEYGLIEKNVAASEQYTNQFLLP